MNFGTEERHARSTLSETVVMVKGAVFTAVRSYSGFSSRSAKEADLLFAVVAERPWV